MHEGHRKRLRERYSKYGIDGFAEHEVLELLLTYAIPRRNTNDIAHALLQRFGSLHKVLQAEVEELAGVEGIGEHAAVFMRLLGEVLRREMLAHAQLPGEKRLYLNTPAIAATYAIHLIGAKRYECVYVAALDKNMRLLHGEELFSGTLTEAPLYPRRVVESALRHGAYSVLLLHNHPSGDPSPSKSDLAATEAVTHALNSIDIQLYDHLIVGERTVFSCRRGILMEPSPQYGEAPLSIRLPAEKEEPAAVKAAEPLPKNS